MQMIYTFIYKLPLLFKFIFVFVISFLMFLFIFIILRIIGIKVYGSERQYYKENNDPLTFRQIWLRSLIGSVIIIVTFIIILIIR